jgi:hypothetical protein
MLLWGNEVGEEFGDGLIGNNKAGSGNGGDAVEPLTSREGRMILGE